MAEESWENSLNNYRDLFSKFKCSFVNPLELQSYQTLTKLMSLAFKSGTASVCLLMGSKGTGRKKALQFAIDKNYVSNFITVNCLIYDNLVSVYEKILIDCDLGLDLSVKYFGNKVKGKYKVIDLWEHVLSSYFRSRNVVIYISSIDKLCKTNQNFLYTFLDSLNFYAPKIFVAFGTDNISFLDKLERRVRSRLSSNIIYFGTKEDNIIHFLKIFFQNAPESKELNLAMQNYLNLESVKSLLEHIFSLSCNYSIIIKIFCGLFCKIDAQQLEILASNTSEGREIFEKAFLYSVNAFCKYDYGPVYYSLPQCHKIILYVIIDRFDASLNTSSIKFNALLDSIQNKSHLQKFKVNHEYSLISVSSALEDLYLLGYIHFKAFPLTPYSEIVFRGNQDLRELIRKYTSN